MAARNATSEAGDAGRRPPQGKLTYEGFLDWCDEDTLAEWVDGEVRMASPASWRHQDIVSFLLVILRMWVRRRDLGVVLPAPFQMRLAPPINRGREPDILFVARAHLGTLRNTYLDGPADLVVEVTSPESLSRDRGEKFAEYEAAGIPEYWFIDPDRHQAEFYRLGFDGRYALALGGAQGEYESPTLSGLRLPIEWLWQDPLPDEVSVLQALGLVS